MQGLADGYFVLPFTIQNYLADEIHTPRMNVEEIKEFVDAKAEVEAHINKLMSIQGSRTVDSIHKELGHLMWDNVGMARNKEGLQIAIEKISALRKEFWKEVKVPGTADSLNIELEKANRVADFLELGELMARDALHREESAGGHFREEHQTEEGEAKRDDANFTYVAAWEYKGEDVAPELHKEELEYEAIEVKVRNYK
jgi:succinate dehydrogenase / fumarate reductase flavoprotein subunit